MKLLADWILHHGGVQRKIELLQGDLACLPPEHAVDILVVSAFPNDYLATPGSLIGALDREGLSIASLSRSKQADLREEYSCWLSKPVSPRFNFRQVLCIESGWRGTPLQITDDLFRALAPLVLCELVDISVAMPLIGAGDQGCPPDQMLSAILRAAVNWVGRGLKLHVLKIVIHDPQTAQHLLSIFTSHKDEHAACAETPRHDVSADAENFDVFMSYSHKDVELASFMITRLTDAWNGARILLTLSTVRAVLSRYIHMIIGPASTAKWSSWLDLHGKPTLVRRSCSQSIFRKPKYHSCLERFSTMTAESTTGLSWPALAPGS